MEEQVRKLFPQVERSTETRGHWNLEEEEIPLFSEHELDKVLGLIKSKKAPGPDQISPIIVKLYMQKNKQATLDMFNECLKRSVFPWIWKTARLVLVEKPKKAGQPMATYRPLCLIDVAGKVLEALVRDRLNEEVETNGLLDDKQYGFRKGRSTLDPLMRLQEIKRDIGQRAYKNREFAAVVLLDVKNAFNSARWSIIKETLERKEISRYLRAILEDYLSDRSVVTMYNKKHRVTCGVPQGSILGPLLWNLYYDKVLKTNMEKGIELLAYADDVAIVVRAKNKEALQNRCRYAAQRMTEQLRSLELDVEHSKTEIVLMEGRHTIKEITIKMGDVDVVSVENARYLGIQIDRNFRMTAHITKTVNKAHSMANRLWGLMPKTSGLATSKRLLVRSAVVSAVLYGAPVWQDALKYKKYRIMLEGVNRRLAIIVTCSYRTVSTAAVLAMAGTPPIKLMVKERVETHKLGSESRQEVRDRIMASWQEDWIKYEGWASNFIKDVRAWTARKWGALDYYVSQAISGHGVFGVYLCNIRKKENPTCWFCEERDTPEHTIFVCKRFEEERRRAGTKCGKAVTRESVAALMLENEESWNAVAEMLGSIMRSKEKEEKSRIVENGLRTTQ